MPTTVYFATNRVSAGPADAVESYGPSIVAPSSAMSITYGTAFVDGVDVATNTQGAISQLVDVSEGGFSANAMGDLSDGGRHLLVFIHGFDNTFSDAITRAAFNREWLAASGLPGADATVIAFSWPSKGQLVALPILQDDYLFDQNMARNSGFHLMSFFAALDPILVAARANGWRTTLLAHSMGNLALESAVENWFLHGNGNDLIFDQAILAAGDCGYDAFDQPNRARLSALSRLAKQITVFYSEADHVLQLSMAVNLGAQRLGQDGPRGKSDAASFPPGQYTMLDCTGFRDYDFNFLSSHQYYRQSPRLRAVIAASLCGQRPPAAQPIAA